MSVKRFSLSEIRTAFEAAIKEHMSDPAEHAYEHHLRDVMGDVLDRLEAPTPNPDERE